MKKGVISIALFITGLAFSYVLVAFGIVGFLIGKYGGGKREGIEGRIRSIIIPMGKLRLHLHHWLIGTIMMLVCWVQGLSVYIPPEILYGVIGGFAWQGVYCYADWHRVVYRNPHRE
ncbi:MAG: hypothetical protein FJZ95_01140 [Chloroflexi bacterium]|nr:hypothetical protein [Chloroflexota bacterium]